MSGDTQEQMMAVIRIVEPIEVTHRGPEVLFDDEWRLIHLQQGALDGACGPYCVFMALVIARLLDPNELGWWVDGRTRLGKLQSRMGNGSGLFGMGTTIVGLGDSIRDSFGAVAQVEFSEDRGAGIREFAVRHLLLDRPVVIGLEGSNLAHWVLAVGLEYADSEAKAPRRMLVLDPASPVAPVSGWNRVIDLEAGRGRYPYVLWPADERANQQAVQLAHGASIWA